MLPLDEILSIIGKYKLLPTEEQVSELRGLADDGNEVDKWATLGLSNLDAITQRRLSDLIDFVIKPQLVTIPSLGTVDSRLTPGPILYPPSFLKIVRGSQATRDLSDYKRYESLALGSGLVLDIVNPRLLIQSGGDTEDSANVRATTLDMSALIFVWHAVRAILQVRVGRGEVGLNVDANLLKKFVAETGLQNDTWGWVRYLKSVDLPKSELIIGAAQWLADVEIPFLSQALKEDADESLLEPVLSASVEKQIADLPDESAASLASGLRYSGVDKITTVYNQIALHKRDDNRVVTISILTEGTPEWRAAGAPRSRPLIGTTDGLDASVIDGLIEEIRTLCLGLSVGITDPTASLLIAKPGRGATGEEPVIALDQYSVEKLATTAALTAAMFSAIKPMLVAANKRILNNGYSFLQLPYPRMIYWADTPESLTPIDDSADYKSSFIATALPLAREVEKTYRIPVAVTLAQAALESNWGRTAEGNNWFAIKRGSSWQGSTHIRQDDCGGCEFRSYSTVAESFSDYGNLISKQYGTSDLPVKNSEYERWLDKIVAGGYATSTQYSNLTKRIVRDNGYDRLADGDASSDAATVNTTTEEQKGGGSRTESERSDSRTIRRARKRLRLGEG